MPTEQHSLSAREFSSSWARELRVAPPAPTSEPVAVPALREAA